MSLQREEQERAACALMFSGGRDSTLAAVRLAAVGTPLILVTVTTWHLVGVENVRQRLVELSPRLPPGTRWMRVQQPKTPATFGDAFAKTCLPCQHDYAVAGALIAKQLGMLQLAFGYASYQAAWPEQTPQAITLLGDILEPHGIELTLPVYDLKSRADARAQLLAAGLSDTSLEQKCIKQITNITLDEATLVSHLSHWSAQLAETLTENVDLEIIEEMPLRDLTNA